MSQAKRSTAVTVDEVAPAASEVKSGAAELAQQLADAANAHLLPLDEAA